MAELSDVYYDYFGPKFTVLQEDSTVTNLPFHDNDCRTWLKLMALCKIVVSLLHQQWKYHSLSLSHWNDILTDWCACVSCPDSPVSYVVSLNVYSTSLNVYSTFTPQHNPIHPYSLRTPSNPVAGQFVFQKFAANNPPVSLVPYEFLQQKLPSARQGCDVVKHDGSLGHCRAPPCTRSANHCSIWGTW